MDSLAKTHAERKGPGKRGYPSPEGYWRIAEVSSANSDRGMLDEPFGNCAMGGIAPGEGCTTAEDVERENGVAKAPMRVCVSAEEEHCVVDVEDGSVSSDEGTRGNGDHGDGVELGPLKERKELLHAALVWEARLRGGLAQLIGWGRGFS
jgi:hypothetical protein